MSNQGLRYHDIANEIRSRIVEGRYGYGDVLPSQSAIAKEFSTTVMTVRQALRMLESEGLVESRHGVGSFVTGLTEEHRGFELKSFSQSVDVDATVLTTEVVDRIRAADNSVASVILGERVSEGTACTVSSLIRLRGIDGHPLVYQKSYVDAEFWPVVRDYQPGESLYGALSTGIHTVISQAHEQVSAVIPPGDVAAHLSVGEGTPCLYSERTSMDAGGRPVLFDQAYMRSEYIHIALRRNGRNADVRFVVDRGEG